MKIGIIYAGQGSQKLGMGQDFYDTYPTFKETIDGASAHVKDVTDFDIKDCCFCGPIEKLSQTRYTQPCMVAFAIGITKLLKEKNIKADYVCGLSLGEYSALYEAGVLDEDQVLNLVAYRGKVMEEACGDREVKMAAVLMLDRETVENCCKKARQDTGLVVEAANYNCPGQIVISGDAKAVDCAAEMLKEAGARAVKPLKVSGPFHTSLMRPAGDALRDRFKNETFNAQNTIVIFNASGQPLDGRKSIAQMLETQVQSSVYLEDSIRYMEKEGVDVIIEVGPGKAISKFVKKTSPDIRVYSIDTVEDFEQMVSEIG